jgi:asparagine synthase (glutamine-hydrolysing)
MCGIAGVVALAPTAEAPGRETLTRMAAALRHRGPDGFGIYRDARAGLSHARLSIIDLSGGGQPLSNEDGSLWIVFNGEIFNYLELREALVAAGHRFSTRSDTEVIVHAWEQWGAGCFERMNGQWALALWDSREETLVLSRDPYGILPLYVVESGGKVWFASEVKAIFAGAPELPRRLDAAGLAQVFTFWSTVPPQTVFQGVRELEPGKTRIYRRGKVTEQAHFQEHFPRTADRFPGPFEEAARVVRETLERATALRITRSDVPVGSYLSGGLDSSLLASLGRDYAGRRFATFSLRFEDAEYDETRFQRMVSERLATDHHELLVRRRDIADSLPAAVWHAERPFLRTAPVPMFLLSRAVREAGTKVVLTGEGADEMFAGYDLFREGRVRRFWARRPESSFRPRLLERLYPYLARSPVAQAAVTRQFFGRNLDQVGRPGFAHDPRWRSTQALLRLWSTELRGALGERKVVDEFLSSLPGTVRALSPLAQDQYIENRTLLAGYLLSIQGDRVLMAHSVEGRFPFLDPEVTALANALPDAFKLRGLEEKLVLKRLGMGVLPEEVVQRKKQPYRAPDAAAFVGSDAPEWVERSMGEEAVRRAGLFQVDGVRALRKKLREADPAAPFSNADNMAVVGILTAQLLHEQFVERWTGPEGDVSLNVLIERPAPASPS